MTEALTPETGPGHEPLISWRDVHKVYSMGSQSVHALRGVNLDIHRGEYWAIMGPSGSGKSTMLNLLGCLDRPTRGICSMIGSDLNSLDDDRLSELRLRHIGFIFQSFNLIPQLTVRENIELPLFYMGWEARRGADRAAELAGMVGLADRMGHRPAELSGGQQQRVAVARALAAEPEVLLADEPTGNLDTKTSLHIMELLDELNSRGRTVILVTHEPDIAGHAGITMRMRDGRVEDIAGKPPPAPAPAGNAAQ